MGKDGIQMNRETIELRYVEQIVDAEQTNVLGYLVKYAEQTCLMERNNPAGSRCDGAEDGAGWTCFHCRVFVSYG